MLRTRVNQAAGHEVDSDVNPTRANEDRVALGAKNSREGWPYETAMYSITGLIADACSESSTGWPFH